MRALTRWLWQKQSVQEKKIIMAFSHRAGYFRVTDLLHRRTPRSGGHMTTSAVPRFARALAGVLITIIVSWLIRLGVARGSDLPKPAQLAPDQEKRVREGAHRHLDKALRHLFEYYGQRDPLFAALAEAQEKLALEKKHFPSPSQDMADSLAVMAVAHLGRKNYEGARKARREELAILTKLYGEGHWQVTNARLALADVKLAEDLSADNQAQEEDFGRFQREGFWYDSKANYRAAMTAYRKLVETARKLVGPHHPHYADCLALQARMHFDLQEYDQAEKLWRVSLDGQRKLRGEDHPVYARGAVALAELLWEIRGDFVQAEKYLKQGLQIQRDVLKQDRSRDSCFLTSGCSFYCPRSEYANSLVALGALYMAMSDYKQAEPLLVEGCEILEKIVEKFPSSYIQGLNDVGDLYRPREDCVQADHDRSQVLSYATAVDKLARLYGVHSDYAKADRLINKALGLRLAVMGDRHPVYGQSLLMLGHLQQTTGDYNRAEELYRAAGSISARVFGDSHLANASHLYRLGRLCGERGDFVQAEKHLNQVLGLYKSAVGEEHADYAAALDSLGSLYRERGDFVRAEDTLRQALNVRRKVLGEEHLYFAGSLNSLGLLSLHTGDYIRAETLLHQSRKIAEKRLGEEHLPEGVLNNLAILYTAKRDYPRAKALLEKAVEINKQILKGEHPSYARSLNNLALVYDHLGNYAQASLLYRQALDIQKRVLGEESLVSAYTLSNLARVYCAMGQPVQAKPFLRKALEMRRKDLGENHLAYAANLIQLGWLHVQMGHVAEAEPLLRQALEISLQKVRQTSAIQSERQQLAMLRAARSSLDDYLSLAIDAKLDGDPVYQHMLWWKGAVFARQRWLRIARESADQETFRLFEELRQISSRLASLLLDEPDSTKMQTWKSEIGSLNEQREQLERDLSRRSDAFRLQQAVERGTVEQIKACLPTDAALVDLLEYTHFRPPAQGETGFRRERRVLAFVVRPGRPVAFIDVGLQGPIARAVAQWRKTVTGERGKQTAAQIRAASELRRLLWQPLSEHLIGVRALMISPDGILARFPFSALPGSRPGTYLIEEYSISIVCVPQLLPELTRPKRQAPSAAEVSPSLLLVGGVEYGNRDPRPLQTTSEPGTALSLRGNRLLSFDPLPGTSVEIAEVRTAFQQAYARSPVEELSGAGARKAEFRTHLPNKRNVHLATHGFFAPPELRSILSPSAVGAMPSSVSARVESDLLREPPVLTGLHPGLLSGLVFAGANHNAESPADSHAGDAILTALEVAELDLRAADLVVLSACETGLGAAAGGEGLLGLQRAFQVSGARSVLASLWKVDDAATRILMTEFYHNHWEKKLSKQEALRQAQLTMIRRYEPRESKLRGPGELVRVDPRATEHAEKVSGAAKLPLSPFYWAAFVLSGDWR
jgi:CHAT domain-containing protein/Flp pilus assembly protein TadD